jgi:hypothetical protein
LETDIIIVKYDILKFEAVTSLENGLLLLRACEQKMAAVCEDSVNFRFGSGN